MTKTKQQHNKNKRNKHISKTWKQARCSLIPAFGKQRFKVKASLAYIMSSKPARVTQWNFVSKTKLERFFLHLPLQSGTELTTQRRKREGYRLLTLSSSCLLPSSDQLFSVSSPWDSTNSSPELLLWRDSWAGSQSRMSQANSASNFTASYVRIQCTVDI